MVKINLNFTEDGFTPVFSADIDDSDSFWDAQFMETEYRKKGKKVFSAQTLMAANTPYFYEWAATRLGVTREVAKRLIHLRCYSASPLQVAEEIAKNSSLPEVRNSCETYINDLKGTTP